MLNVVHRAGHYRNRLAQEVARRTGWRMGRPADVIMILTYRCNARCVHCYSYDMPRMKELTGAQWMAVCDELREWLGPVFLSITGGEPLLRKDAIDIAAHAAGRGLWVEFLTNGWVVDEAKAERLVASGVRRIKISLDGNSPDIHDRVRGVKGFHERAANALRLVSRKVHEAGADVQIYAKTAIMSINVDHLAPVVRLARELELYGVELQAIEPVYYSDQQGDPNWYKNNRLWIKEFPRAQRALDELRQLKREGFPILNSMVNLDLMEGYFRDPAAYSDWIHSHDYQKRKPDCRAWLGGLQIDPAGGMRMCHWMDAFANAADGNLREAWKHRRACHMCGLPK